MKLYILMSIFNGKAAHVLEDQAIKKAAEVNIELISFPENGIHPQFHMELADKYLSCDNDNIVVTHSENLLLRVLRRIRTKDVDRSNVQLLLLTPYINHPEKGFYWKNIDIDGEGEFIDHIPGGFFEQGFNERFDIGELEKITNKQQNL